MRKVFLSIAILAIAGFLASSFYEIFYKNQNAFDETRTTIKIEGPESLETGETAGLSVSYKNGNKANLKNAVLTLNFPAEAFTDIKDASGFGKIRDSAIVWELGDISSGYESTLRVSAKIMDAGANKLAASLDYEPENFNSSFSAKKEYALAVKPAKISLSLFAPKESVANQEVKYILTYTNATALNFNSVRIKMNYPAGFIFTESNPPAGEGGSSWEIQNFARASSGQIEVRGVLGGDDREVKAVGAIVEQKDREGKFIFNNEITAATNLISSPFNIVQLANDKESYSANAGETLNYKIKFRNLSKVRQSNLIVSAALSGDAVDYATLAADGAAVDKQARTVIWDGKSKPGLMNLDPDKEAEVDFSVKINDEIAIADSSNKNFVIKNAVTLKNGSIFNADGTNKVIVSASFDTKINSSVVLYAQGLFNDDGRLKTSGPIPPKVGQTTTYNIKWQILNASNKIKNVKVTGILPADARWAGNIFPIDGRIFYDVTSRMITWEAGDIEAGTGILSPLKEIIFQLSVTPEAKDIGSYLVLIDQNSLTATDDFTLSEISSMADGITTRLPDDISIGSDDGKVAM